MTKEERKEYNKLYYQKNKDKHNEYCKAYNEQHKQEIKEYHQKYYQENRECLIDRSKAYCQKNKQTRKYYRTMVGRSKSLYYAYKNNDAKKGFDTCENISDVWILDNILNNKKCYYCGESDWRKLGADRVDNTKPHTADNVICCCAKCNLKRKNKYSVEEFKKMMTKQ